jgi:hypothetical protein
MARPLVKREQEIEVRECGMKTVNYIFKLEFHISVGPVPFLILPVPKRLEER